MYCILCYYCMYMLFWRLSTCGDQPFFTFVTAAKAQLSGVHILVVPSCGDVKNNHPTLFSNTLLISSFPPNFFYYLLKVMTER